ncbi:MAG: hypothetical protein GY777_20580 [Candidatus Brocadiaceae bacterium]|nr:hypothetical protein [Candidatus Brocadiaceae bacterium]
MPVITVPKPLRERLGEEASDAFAEFVKEIDLEARKDALALAEERLERRLAEEIGKLRAEMKEEIGKLRAEIKEDMGKLRAETIKWMFIFWVSQIGILSGIIFALLRLMIN